GSGKSTIIKLLCRLYDPDHGRIDIDGVDLRRLRLADVRRRIAVLMQEPMRYDETARDNVAFGAEGDLTPEALDRIARGAGADEVVASLPEGWDSRLGRFFVDAGAELSVGQWQRLALARALARGARVVLLDEPTSALDAWAEVGWPLRLREAAGDSTIVLITHRFTTAMHADRIHVFDRDGRVVESGNHAELLAADGTYARSWRAQTGIA
ncbi:MAG: ATP-binding cassette domain-containing protein, partial [Acidobacteriota bacterium]